jgi:hypothetical protein
MQKEEIAPEHNVLQLKTELANYYKSPRFVKAKNMGDLLRASLMQLLVK